MSHSTCRCSETGEGPGLGCRLVADDDGDSPEARCLPLSESEESEMLT